MDKKQGKVKIYLKLSRDICKQIIYDTDEYGELETEEK